MEMVSNKRKQLLLIVGVLFIGILAIVGSYAYWSWNSSNNKTVVFNTSKAIQEYIIYDDGESKFIGDFKISESYLDGIYSTISVKKTEEAANYNLFATIYMDINEIGEYMKVSPALKWAITSGDSSSNGQLLNSGSFYGSKAGETIELKTSFEVTTTEQKFTIWIWIDANESVDENLTGETLDVNVFTQIDQVVVDRFEITSKTARYQIINATAINSTNNITHYAVTTENTEPSSWDSIDASEQAKIYNLEYTASSIGTYYVWFKDTEGNIISNSVEVTTVDTTQPICTWSEFNPDTVADGETTTINLTCVDNESGIVGSVITKDDITLSNNYVILSDTIAKEKVADGYKYTFTVVGTDNVGSTTLTLPMGKITNEVDLENSSVTSSELEIVNDKIAPILSISVDDATTYAKLKTMVIKVQDTSDALASGTYTIKYAWGMSEISCSEMTNSTTITVASGETSVTTSVIISEETGAGKVYVCNSEAILDISGNSLAASTVVTANMYLDNTKPDGSISVETTDSTATATLSVNDNDSGLSDEYGYSISTDSTCDSSLSFVTANSANYTFTLSSPGEYYICASSSDIVGNTTYILSDKFVITLASTFEYTGNYQEYVVPADGYYFIEAYGGSGGAANGYVPGYGAYTSGVIELKAGEKLYIYVGGKGANGVKTASTTTSGGYNGGGNGYVGSTAYYVSGGGGATDIRYIGSTDLSESDLVWNSTLGLNSRIMVAAGGSGRVYNTSTYRTKSTASGGYLIGSEASGQSSSSATVASGGKQNGAGDNGTIKGTFGVGASAGTNSGYPGAGGGYYGGNASAYAAGGGSSFISGYAGVNAITSSSDRTHTNNTIHYSGKYFINGRMEIYANYGNGSAKITYLGLDEPSSLGSNYQSVRYIKDCKGKRTIVAGDDTDNTCYTCRNWREIQAIKDGVNLAKGKTITIEGSISSWASGYSKTNATDGIITSAGVAYASTDDGIVCAIVDLGSTYDLDEIAVWDTDNAYFANHTLSVSTDGSTWKQIASIGSANGIQGTRGNPYSTMVAGYAYSGTEKTLEISMSGCYKFEVWGASGGSTSGSGTVYTLRGGIGGYSRGFKYLETGQTLYINIGGAGSDVNKWAIALGGYNGGGNGAGINSSGSSSQGNLQAAGGGGATHIATSSGLLSALDDDGDTSDVLIVAGGGGGSTSNEGNYSEGYYSYHYGGSAGGYKGNSSSVYTYGSYGDWTTFISSTGGSQTSGGLGGDGWGGTANLTSCTTSRCYIGQFGQGGTLSSNWTPSSAAYAGGGGGYYGGGLGYHVGGGGGSSYIGGVDSLAVMVAYNSVSSTTNSIRTISLSGYSYYAISNMPRRGNGYARIYYVGSVCP